MLQFNVVAAELVSILRSCFHPPSFPRKENFLIGVLTVIIQTKILERVISRVITISLYWIDVT